MPKPDKHKDPFRAREAEKYEFPIPSREFILQHLEEIGRPMSFRQIATAFDLTDDNSKEGLRRRIRAMLRDGQIISNRKGAYGLATEMELVRGVVIGHRDGYGFVETDDSGSDIFLSARQMRQVMPDDRVLVRVTGIDKRNRREGAVVEVLEYNTQRLVGRYYQENGVGLVEPDNKANSQTILIPRGKQAKAVQGQFVTVEITSQPSRKRQPVGRVLSVLGDHLTPGMEVELAVRSHDLPFEWPKAVLREAKKLPKKVKNSEIKGRLDLRQFPFVTIDGEDARDFDDAIYCERREDLGWNLSVAIADVTYYVKPDSALDQEAVHRGNSVYFSQSGDSDVAGRFIKRIVFAKTTRRSYGDGLSDATGSIGIGTSV